MSECAECTSPEPEVTSNLPPSTAQSLARLVAVREQDVHARFVVAIHSSSLPDDGSSQWIPNDPVQRADSMFQRHWAYDRYFYLAFLPTTHAYEPPLDSLSFTRVPIEEVAASQSRSHPASVAYRLPPDLQKSFMALYNLARVLLSAIGSIGIKATTLYPLDTWIPELHAEVLGATYRTRAAVQSMARDSRFKIMAILALISFTITTQTTREDRHRALPLWYTELHRKHADGTLPALDGRRMMGWPAMISALNGTWVFDLTIPRLGGLVEITRSISCGPSQRFSTQWFDALPAIIANAPGVPWWLVFPQTFVQTPSTSPLAGQFQPHQSDIDNFLARSSSQFPHSVSPSPDGVAEVELDGQRCHTGDVDVEVDPTPTTTPAHSMAGPSRLLDQHNITWSEYRQARSQWATAQLAVESDASRANRQTRAAAARRIPPWEMSPRPHVYVWDVNTRGQWLHWTVSARRKRLIEEWDNHRDPWARVYDDVENIFHLSNGFAHPDPPISATALVCEANAGREDESSHYEPLDMPRSPQSTRSRSSRSRSPRRPSVPQSETAQRQRRPSPQARLRLGGTFLLADAAFETLRDDVIGLEPEVYDYQPCYSLADIVRRRWGFNDAQEDYQQLAQVRSRGTLALRRALAYRLDFEGDLSPTDWRRVHDFVFALSDKSFDAQKITLNGTLPDSLATLSDMFPGCSARHPCQLPGHHFVLRLLEGRAQTHYLLEPKAELPSDWPWQIVLMDALTALEVLRRQWGPDKAAVVRELVSRGMAFRTVRFCRAPRSATDTTDEEYSSSRRGVQVCAMGHRPGLDDYKAYLLQREAVLSRPHARAALLKGGIVWRIALEVLSVEDAVLGPQFGDTRLSLGGPHVPFGYGIDDDLCLQELDILCGVYRILTSDNAHRDASLSSWWPRQETWTHCGHNHGYWSWANELWYRSRRDAILSGSATVLTGAQWAQELKGDKHWWVGRRKLEEIAASSIERQCCSNTS